MKKAAVLLVLLPGIAFAGARVSATKVDSKLGKSYYAGSSAIDGKLDTVWMVPGESENKGEWIEIELPKGDIDKLAIYPGHGKSTEAFGDYARVKQLRLDAYSIGDDQSEKQVGTATIDVADKAEMQYIDMTDIKVGDGLFGGKVKLTVLDIYEGEDYPNLAVAEVQVMLKEFDCPKTPVLSEPGNEQAGHEAAMSQDDNVKTFWAMDASGAGFTLSSDAFGLSSIGFQGAGKEYSRPKTVEITVGTVTQRTELADSVSAIQYAPTPGFNGYNGGGFGDVVVKIIDTYPGTNPQIGLAEIKAKASSFSGI